MKYDERGAPLFTVAEALQCPAGEASNVIGDVVVFVRILDDGTYRAEVCHDGGWWEERAFTTLEEVEAAYPQDGWNPYG